MAVTQANNDFLLNIRSVYPSMTKVEKKIADFVLKNPKAVRFMSITDLAEASKVGLTSVFRFCKSLRLGGYHEFKVQLALSLSEGEEEQAVLPGQSTQNDTVESMAQKLLTAHVNALNETLTMTDPDALSRAGVFINTSDQVRFFGMGGSALTAMEGMYKFMHILPNVYCLSDLNMQLMSISTMNEHDTGVFISHSGESKEIVQMAEKARGVGARTVSITRYAKSSLASVTDLVLLCGGYEPPLQEGSFPTKTAQMYVLELLFTEVYRRKFEYSRGINERVTKSILDKDC